MAVATPGSRRRDNFGQSSVIQVYNLTTVNSQVSSPLSYSWKPIGQVLDFSSHSVHPMELSGDGSMLAIVTPSQDVNIMRLDEDQGTWVVKQSILLAQEGENNSTIIQHMTSVSMSRDTSIIAISVSSESVYVGIYKHNPEFDAWQLIAEEGAISRASYPFARGQRIQAMDFSENGDTLALVVLESSKTLLRLYRQRNPWDDAA